MNRPRIIYPLLALSLSLSAAGCHESHDAGPASAPTDTPPPDNNKNDDYVVGQQPVVVTGSSLADFDNTRISCDYSYVGKTTYATHCDVVVHQANGQEVKATGVKDGVTVQWRSPQSVEGKVAFSACAADASSLAFTCDVTATDSGAATQVRYGLDIQGLDSKALTQMRTETVALVLPYSVGITLGFVPGMPLATADQTPFKTREPSASAAAEVPSGYSQPDFAGDAVDFFKPGPICVRDKRVFFAHGLFVYVIDNKRVRIYAGSGNPLDRDPSFGKEHVFFNPGSIACTKTYVYILSSVINMLHRVNDAGKVELLAGDGREKISPDGSVAKDSTLGLTAGLAVSKSGQVYFGEEATVRTILGDGTLKTIAGDGVMQSSGDGGPAIKASFTQISGIVVAGDGSLYVADSNGASVRRIAKDGTISTAAGTGVQRFKDSRDPKALAEPSGLAIDDAGNLYIGEYYRGVKLLTPTGELRQFLSAGDDIDKSFGEAVSGQWSSTLVAPDDLALFNKRPAFTKMAMAADGTFYLNGVHGILAYAPGSKAPVAVAGFAGRSKKNCAAQSKGFATTLIEAPALAYTPQGRLRIIDWQSWDTNQMLIKESFDSPQGQMVQNLAGCKDEPWLSGRNLLNYRRAHNVMNDMGGIAVAPDGSTYLANQAQGTIYKVTAAGEPVLVAGRTYAPGGLSLDPRLAVGTRLQNPTGLALGADGSLYFLENSGELSPTVPAGSRLRRLWPNGVLTTVAGNGTPGDSGDGGAAAAAAISASAVAVAADGRLFIADLGHHKIKMIDQHGTITTIAGTGDSEPSPDTGTIDALTTSLVQPLGIAVTNDGEVFVTTFGSAQVKQLHQRPDGGWNLVDFFGKASPAACAVARASGRAAGDQVDLSIQKSMSVLCNGRPRAIAIQDTCPSAGGSTRIAFSQMFDKYVNVVEVVKPCADAGLKPKTP